MQHSRLFHVTLLVLLLILSSACAKPMVQTKPVLDNPSLFVGLANFGDSEKLQNVHANYSVEWSDENLHSILARLFVQKKGGIMDPAQLPRVVFSPDEVILLTPALRQTFSVATPSDWIVFAIWSSSPMTQALEVTSGGMILNGPNLHFVLSNHRERVSSEHEGITGIRQNPLRALRDVDKGQLMYDPSRYMVDTQEQWISVGHDSRVSELVLDLKGLLSSTGLSTSSGLTTFGTRTPSPSPSTDQSEMGKLKDEISNLKSELSRLQDLITKQAEERARQKSAQP